MENKIKINKEILEELEAMVLYNEPVEKKLDNNKIELEYNETIEYNNKVYAVTIYWIGYDDGEDGGVFTYPKLNDLLIEA